MGSLSTCVRGRPKAEICWRFVAVRWAAFHFQGVDMQEQQPVEDTMSGPVRDTHRKGLALTVSMAWGLRCQGSCWPYTAAPAFVLCLLWLPPPGGEESAVAGNCSSVEMLDWGRTFCREVYCIFLRYWLETKRSKTSSIIVTSIKPPSFCLRFNFSKCGLFFGGG